MTTLVPAARARATYGDFRSLFMVSILVLSETVQVVKGVVCPF